jgi:hypothetical protein
MYYAAATNKLPDRYAKYDKGAKDLAKELLDRMWNNNQDDKGYSVKEERADYNKFFDQEVYIPSGWTGKMANGDKIKSGVKFIDIRSKYTKDPQYQKLKDAYDKGVAPEFNYHRFWGEADIALANGTYAILSQEFPRDILKGDVNGDGEITMADCIALKRYLLNNNYQIDKTNSDVNGDGQIDTSDLLDLYDLV